MAISVVCSGCQSSYSVPDTMAGKRAKCKKCGAVLAVPAASAIADLSDDPFGDLGGSAPAPADASLDDVLSMGSKPSQPPRLASSPSPLGAPKYVPGPKRGSTGASVGAAIAATLLALCLTGVMFFALLCTGDWMLSLVVAAIGVGAAIGCCVLGIMGKPGISWSVFGIYSAICLLGIGKVGYNITRIPARAREIAQEAQERNRREQEELQRRMSQQWPSPTPVTPSPFTPSSPSTNNNHSNPGPAPWAPIDTPSAPLKQPRTDDWKLTLDPPADWAKVGEGRDFNLVLDEPGWNPVRFGHGYARAIAFEHRLGGQEVFEVWDLGRRRKVGQLKGRNNFHREIALGPDGKYVAGEVRPEAGGFYGPIQVWSIATAQKVSEIPAPVKDRNVDVIDFVDAETIFAIYQQQQRYRLSIWNVSDGALKRTIDLGERRVDNRHYALSPGRKYLCVYEKQVLDFYDLSSESSTPAGKIYLPSSHRCEAVTFSPDGTEIAALCDADSKSQMFVWQTQSGEMKSQVQIKLASHDLLQSAEKGGGLPIGWLGTGEGWLLGGKRVIARKDGEVLWTMPDSPGIDQPAKLLDADLMVQVERNGALTRVVMRPFPYGEMDSINKALAAGGTAIDAKLPPLGKPNVASIQEVTWQPNAAWTVTPDPRPALKAGAGNKPIVLTEDRLQGMLFSDPTHAQAVSLDVDRRSPEHTELSPVVISNLTRFDLVTGKSVVRQKVPGGSKLLAVSPSGQRAALTIGNDEGRIDIYGLTETPQHLCAWRPYVDESSKVEGHQHQKQLSRQSVLWAEFIDEDHLLTMNCFDGQLVLWKVPELQAVYRLRTGTDAAPSRSPTRKYVIVQPQDRLAVIEAKTGQVSGTMQLPYDPDNSIDTNAAFSADGARVAATIADLTGALLVAYDMKTGQEISKLPLSGAGDLQWCGPKQLIVGGGKGNGNVPLVDLDKRATVWRYQVFSGYRVPQVPDDRVWLVAGGYGESVATLVAQPFQLTAEVNAAIASLPNNPAPLFGPGTTVGIDAGGVGGSGSPDLAERVKKAWTTSLASRGVKIGEGGLRLTASTSSGESRTEEYTPSRFGFPFPGRGGGSPNQQGNFSFTTTDINMEVKLVDGGGKAHWQVKSVARYYLPSYVQSQDQNKSPQTIMSEQQTAQHKSQVDGFFTGIRLPYLIYPQPTDKDGQPGLGITHINLSSYVQQEPGRRRVKSDTADALEGVRQMYSKVLEDNPSVNIQNWQWCKGIDRPIVALRWGVGVQMDMKSADAKKELQPEPATQSLLRDLGNVSGPLGPMLVQMLRAKQSEGKFGTYADIADDKLREVVLLGSGERAQLAAAARKAAVDVVLIIKLEAIAKGRQRDKQLSLEILDMAAAKPLWKSETLLESRVNAGKQQGQDLIEQLSDKTAEELDSKLLLEPIASMPRTNVLLRTDLPSLHRSNPMAALAEIDGYLCREEIPPATAIAAFNKILGNSTDAADLASEDQKKREAAIDRIVPLLSQKMQGTP